MDTIGTFQEWFQMRHRVDYARLTQELNKPCHQGSAAFYYARANKCTEVQAIAVILRQYMLPVPTTYAGAPTKPVVVEEPLPPTPELDHDALAAKIKNSTPSKKRRK